MRSRTPRRLALATALAGALSVNVAGAATPKVGCPEGMKPLMTQAEYDAAIESYRNEPDELDPLPDFLPAPQLPQPDFMAAWRADRSLPLQGKAQAVVLLREDGHVDAVLVPCATTRKVVKPIVAALTNAIGNVPTRKGVPVKHSFVVPISWLIN